MKRPMTSYSRGSISLVLSLAVGTVFSLHSFAAPKLNRYADPVSAQDFTGTLTVTSGHVTINGNAAQTGATVMTGSTVATSSDGKAIIDLGAAGRVELGDHTSIVLTCVTGLLTIRSLCGRTEVEVRRGVLEVKTPNTEFLEIGKKQKETYGDNFVATSAAPIDVKIECEGRKAGGLYVGPGLLGLLALIGVGAAIATGITIGSNESSAPPSSPIR